MKKIILPLLLLAVMPKTAAQCNEPVQLPYMADAENVTAPALPQCMVSNWETFASQQVFESLQGPVPGFTGNVLAYDTTIDTEFGMPADAYVMATLALPPFYLVQGTAYTVSFRYANSDAQSTIASLSLDLNSQEGNTPIDALENISGAMAADYVTAEFTPPSTGVYYIIFTVGSVGTQGSLYIDHIEVQEHGIMATEHNTLTGLTVYPNPAKDLLNFRSDFPVDMIEIYSTSGQLLRTEKPDASITGVNVGQLQSGVYIVDIRSGSQSKRIRIVRE